MVRWRGVVAAGIPEASEPNSEAAEIRARGELSWPCMLYAVVVGGSRLPACGRRAWSSSRRSGADAGRVASSEGALCSMPSSGRWCPRNIMASVLSFMLLSRHVQAAADSHNVASQLDRKQPWKGIAAFSCKQAAYCINKHGMTQFFVWGNTKGTKRRIRMFTRQCSCPRAPSQRLTSRC